MIFDSREYARTRNLVFSASLVAWLGMVNETGISLCGSSLGLPQSWKLILALTPPTALAKDWLLMLIAMMGPIVGPLIYDVQAGSLGRRKIRAVLACILGYLAVWMAAGAAMIPGGLAVRRLDPQSYLPAILVGVIALVWQFSPAKQICLNRCHGRRPFRVFGFQADRDLFLMGAANGLWCVGACWALMFLPLLVPAGRLVAMAAVAALIFCERLDRPRTPRWQARGFGAALGHLVSLVGYKPRARAFGSAAG